MKKLLLLVGAVALFSIAGFAQKAANYAGTWKLDKAQSKLDQRMSAGIDSMTWTVSQTGNELKIVSDVKRAEAPMAAPPAGGPPVGGGGGRGMGRGGFGGGDGTTVYSLDGKETTGELDGPMGKMPVSYKATTAADGSVVLTSSRTINGPNGEAKVTTKESWKLSADGKTLTVDRENTSPRGTQTSTLVFVKA